MFPLLSVKKGFLDIQTDTLLRAYREAVSLELSGEFIALLESELARRGAVGEEDSHRGADRAKE